MLFLDNAGCHPPELLKDKFSNIKIVFLDSLISHAMGTLQHCSADEYLTGDNSLPVCVDIDGNNWDENWLNSLTEGAESVDEDTST